MENRLQFLQSRRGRYLAQTLEEFERTIEPLIPADVAKDFKGIVRRKFGALAKEAEDLMGLDGEINGIAQTMKDALHPDTAPSTRGGS